MSEFSWAAMVYAADKDFNEPQYVYEFGSGRRRFYPGVPDTGEYTLTEDFLVDADGNYIVDADGNRIGVRT